MAHVLPEWPCVHPARRTMSHYDWDQWLDGQVWALTEAEYGGDLASFRNAAYAYTRWMRGKVRTMKYGQYVLIQWIGADDE